MGAMGPQIASKTYVLSVFTIIGLQFSKKEIVQPGQTNQTRAGAEISEGHLHGLRDAMLLG